MAKTYNSVSEMLKDMGISDPDEIEKKINARSVSTAMIISRCKRSITQEELAKRLNVDVKWVQTIEDTENEFMTLADMEKYYKGLDMKFEPKVLPL